MASNKNLIISIAEAATRKGVDVPKTEDKRNAELTAILRDLNAKPDAPKAPDGDGSPESKKPATLAEMREAGELQKPEKQDDEDNDAPAIPAAVELMEQEAEAEPYPFSVAPGKALTCKRGMIAEGEEVTAEDFPGGEERLAELVASGHIATPLKA